MVASGRTLALGHFDHPPASWWIVWAITHLLHSEARLVVRLPFLLLFGLTTSLMYRATSQAYQPRAGVWCAVALNLSPMFGVTTGSWVLPDGPLMAALAGALLCFLQALEAKRGRAWTMWTMTGLCAGLAMLSKYSAAMPMIGGVGYLMTSPRHRFWLLRPEPYVAGVLVLLIFSPVILWNAQHHWASFAFQGGRAIGSKFRLLAPLSVLSGEMLFLLPWIGVPLLAVLVRSFRSGPDDWRSWMFACMAVVPVLFFPVVAVWSQDHVLYHWAAPGFLMLFPPLGLELARHARNPLLPRLAVATAAMLVAGAAVTGTEVRWNWLPKFGEDFAFGQDPDLQAVDWISLRPAIKLLTEQHPGLVVAGTRWHECGKLSYALGPRVSFLCLARDSREFGQLERPIDYAGRDILIASPRNDLRAVTDAIGSSFSGIEQLTPTLLLHAGKPAMQIPLFLGHDFRDFSYDRSGLGHLTWPWSRPPARLSMPMQFNTGTWCAPVSIRPAPRVWGQDQAAAFRGLCQCQGMSSPQQVNGDRDEVPMVVDCTLFRLGGYLMARILEDRLAGPDDEIYQEGLTVSTHNQLRPGVRPVPITAATPTPAQEGIWAASAPN